MAPEATSVACNRLPGNGLRVRTDPVQHVLALERRGLLIADPEYPCLDLETGSSLDHLLANWMQRLKRVFAMPQGTLS